MVKRDAGEVEALLATFQATYEVPGRVLETYARLWQLEIWLRQLVYLEFSTAYGHGWRDHVQAPRSASSLGHDRALHHMPTPEDSPLSYASFNELCITIADDKEWPKFASYLPPRDIWLAKIVELGQIRNRVAHFRIGHRDDLARVLQLLRDVDQGFWRFCTSYNGSSPVLPPRTDPVAAQFAHLDQLGYAQVEGGGWARVGMVDARAVYSVTVDVGVRPWANPPAHGPFSGEVGCYYDVHLFALRSRRFDYHEFLTKTKRLRSSLVHIVLEALGTHVRVTIPACLGEATAIDVIAELVGLLDYTLRAARKDDEGVEAVQSLADEWPEYVIGPNDPLAFLDPGMRCSFFAI